MPQPEPSGDRASAPGCVRAAVGAAALVVLAPIVAAVRQWRRWRRGSQVRIARTRAPFETAGGELIERIDLDLDAPVHQEAASRRRLTDAVVRLAEALRTPDDVYHVIYREACEAAAVASPVGPLVQELGERFDLLMARESLALCTMVWLTLPAHRHLGEVVDIGAYDPETAGEPDGLVAGAAMRWAAASTFTRRPELVRFRLQLYVPTRDAHAANRILDRLAGGSAAAPSDPDPGS